MCAVFESKLVLTALDVRMRCEFLVRLCEGSRTSRGVPGLDPRWKTCRLYFVSPLFFRTKGCDVCMSLWISRVFQTTYVNIVQGHLFDLGNGLAVCSLVCIPSWLAGQTASSTSSTARPGRIWQDSKNTWDSPGSRAAGAATLQRQHFSKAPADVPGTLRSAAGEGDELFEATVTNWFVE